MKKILLSLPQVEWSCFVASYLQNILQTYYATPVQFDLLEKNSMDEITFPCIGGNVNVVNYCELSKKYDLIVNADTDLLLSKFLLNKYHSIENIQECIYNSSNYSIWESIAKYFSVSLLEPKFYIKIKNKTRKNRSDSGVAIKNDMLRMYVKNAFFAEDNRLWHVPVRQNLIKRYDECNTVKNIITDDIFCALSGFVMNKDVIFLKLNECTPNIHIKEKIHIQDIGDFVNAAHTQEAN
jgi:hypothetical protein